MARIKTRYVGVYYRFAKHRIMADGKPDKCYDILYHANGKYVWEKIDGSMTMLILTPLGIYCARDLLGRT